MSLKIPDVGLPKLLDLKTGKVTGPPTYTCKLFQNNYTPVAGSVAGDFTECTFSGYGAGQTITGWASAAVTGSIASAAAAALTWTHNGGGTSNNIYGMYVVDAGGVLIWAERDPAAPFAISANGQTYTVTPQLTDESKF